MTDRLLLTGATGLLGRYLLRDLLNAGVPLAVLVRPDKHHAAHERLDRLLAHLEWTFGQPLPRPVCLAGDVTRPGLGLSGADRGWAARHCARVLHDAASLAFHGTGEHAEPWRTNAAGTANLLRFSRDVGLREWHYVSTAYVCGDRPDVVSESDAPLGPAFRNDYERSKGEAERLLRSADWLDARTVYRPAIVVGDSRTGYTSTYHGPYRYFHFVWLLRQAARLDAAGRWTLPLRLTLTGDERRNFVPVDWAAAAVTAIVRDPRLHGRTYHLAPAEPLTTRALERSLADYFGFTGPSFVGPDGLRDDDRNELERVFYDAVGQYEPYWSREPWFDCSNVRSALPQLPCPVLDAPLLRRLLDFAIGARWGKRPAE